MPRDAAPVNVSPPQAARAQGAGGRFPISKWDLLALVGGGIGAALWYGWSAMDVKDPVTPFYIMAIPVIIVFLRKPLDALLAPLQKIKQHIPRLLLIGAGLAAPYLVADFIYKHKGQWRLSDFDYARWSIVAGAFVSYFILRIPQGKRLHTLTNPAGLANALLWGLPLAASLVATDAAWADDFARDPRRLEDGMRTPGYAQAIAGTAATVISALVNGALVFQRPGRQPPEGSGEEPPIQYTMDIRTEDERMSLAADGQDRLWMYAQILCSIPAVNTQSLTSAISFTFGGSRYADWMSIKSTQFHSGCKAVLLACTPPSPEANVEEGANVTVTVSGTTADGQPIQVPVTIALDPPLEMKIDILA